jgi:DNA-binding NarL/FixJ family response regulator
MKNNIKLLIVDDHKMFLEGIQSILSETDFIEVVGTAKNGLEAIKLTNSFLPDVIITDLTMPELDGIELTEKIKDSYENIKVLVVSSHIEGEMISKAIKAGINGYIFKNTGKTELLKAIKKIANGENYYTEEVKESLQNSLFNPAEARKQVANISTREKEILQLIAEELNTQEIADKLFISPNTVEVHRKNLMRKIGTKNMIGLVKYAIQQGIVH